MSKDTIVALHAEHQGRWKNREEIAERMIALIGKYLELNKSIPSEKKANEKSREISDSYIQKLSVKK